MLRFLLPVALSGLLLWPQGPVAPAPDADHAIDRSADQSADRNNDHGDHKVLIRDVASVEGIRDNSLIGYGLVVGLRGTGDKQQTTSPFRLWPASWRAWVSKFR